MPPLPADSIHARACKLKCEKILTRPNPFTGTVERKIGNTWYLLETVCDGNEPLTHKVKRLIFSDKEALCS